MLPFKKIVGPDYKEGYKRTIHSKFLSTDPEVKKRFGVFKVTELLKTEDKQHFKNLYNYDTSIVEQYKLPEEKKEFKKKSKKKEKAEKERESAEKADLNVSMTKPEEDQGQVRVKTSVLNIEGLLENPDEDTNNKNLMEIFTKLFDPKLQREEMKELEEELYEKKDSKTSKRIAAVDNGEKAVQFFAMYGGTTPIKFIFCQKKQYSGQYNYRPYDLEKIDADKVKDDYFIITPSGISHIYKLKEKIKDSQPSEKYPKEVAEFYTLSDWMYQSTLFNILKRINYYKQYMSYKIFTIWRNFNRFKKFLHIRNEVSNKLFLCKPAFVEKLITCNGEIHQMDKVTLHKLVNDQEVWKNRNMSDFETAQNSVYDIAKSKFKDILEKELFTIIKSLYRTISERLKETKDIDETENSKTLQELKNKSMYRLKIEKKMRAKLIKMASDDVQMFDSFITMIDLMFVEKTYILVKKNLKEMKKELYKERKKESANSAIFQLTASFTEGNVTLLPNDHDFREKFKILFDNMVQRVTDVPRFISTMNKKDYEQIFFGDAKDHQENERSMVKLNEIQDDRIRKNFRDLIDKSKYFKDFTEEIYTKLISEYRNSMNEVVANLNNFRQFEKDRSLSAIEFMNKKPEIEEVRSKFDYLKQWRAKVDLLPTSIPLDIMTNYLQQVKDEFLTYINDFTNALENQYVLEQFKELNSEVSKEIKNYKNVRQPNRCNQVAQACDYKKSLNSTKEQMTETFVKLGKLTSLAQLIKAFDIKSVLKTQIEDFNYYVNNFKEVEKGIEEDCEEIEKNKKNLVRECNDNLAKLKIKIKEVNNVITTGMYLDVETDRQVIESGLKQVENTVNECINKAETNNSYLKILGEHSYEDEDLEKLKKNFEMRNKLWRALISLESENEEWKKVSLINLKHTKIEERVREFRTTVLTITQSMSETVADGVLDYFNEQVIQQELVCPVIVALSSPSMQDRNWKKIFNDIITLPYNGIDSLNMMTLGELLDNYAIAAHLEEVEAISSAAVAQEKIQNDLDKITADWAVTKFVIQPQQNNKASGNYIITTVEDIMTLLDEHSQLIASAMGNKHLGDMHEKVSKWDEDLNLTNRIIEEWLMVQKQWIYLENIFSADDIKKQLEHANTLFTAVNKAFKTLMVKTYNEPFVMQQCRTENLLDQLMRYNKQLDIIQKSLEDYLQKKRAAFPRFYFLSNDELLKILSQTRNPRAVQDYLNKCFDGIKTINFASQLSNEILAMVSPENEEVKLTKTLFAHENIEAWLNELEAIMFSTIYDETKACLEAYPNQETPRKDWIYAGFPCQSVITVDQIMWANLVEKTFLNLSSNGNALKNFSKYMKDQILELADLVSSKVGELKKSLVERLIIINVHARDVVLDLIKENVQEKNNFEWQKNLKFYWEMESSTSLDRPDRCEVVIRQTNSRFIYGYEYLGNPERMVITPLTDKCYITLTSALHLNYGGAPAGPAGTGKTETTKDLSKAMAIKVNVFNCTDQLDIQMMGRMFCGLAECGAWACFDEFNRIDLEVLSVIAQQVETIQSHLRSKTWNMIFEGKHIILKPRFGVFITMNPGYAGRSELPDNLKSLFRPVAMMIPDYALVSEVTLYSKGFKEAKDLSIKMYQLFKLSSEQLSKQKHYDFGLRGIKSILSRAGYLKQKAPNDPENVVLIRAMKDSNLPKFLDADIELFLDIIKDLFPKTVVEKQEDEVLQNKIKEVLTESNLQHTKDFCEKVTQLLDTMMVRLGNMLVGNTGTGKTSMYNTLAKTLTELSKVDPSNPWYCPIMTNVLNPKSVTKFELYMAKDEITQTWEDGIVAKLMRQAEEEEKEGGNAKRRWIVFDGPVDALWIEDMNTVLDDSRKLCLPDSSNIRIPKLMNLIFEVLDLKVASPATVSRCGMVYIEDHHLGYLPIIETWSLNYKSNLMKEFAEEYNKKNLKDKIDSYFKYFDKLTNDLKFLIQKIFEYIRPNCKEKIPSTNVNLVKSCLNFINCFVNKDEVNYLSTNVEEKFNLYLAFSLVWSFGANLEDKSREAFSKFAKDLFYTKLNVNFETNEIYDVYVHENGLLAKWSDLIKENFVYNKDAPFFEILVPTTDTEKYKYLMRNLNKFGFHSLFTGETGVGKSVIVMDYLRNDAGKSDHYLSKSSNFSAKTTSKNIFDTLKSAIYKNGNFQPQNGKKFIYFIDDINLPGLDEYGSQQPIEFLRQLIDNKSFYDEKKTLKKIKDCIFMASCAPPSGGRNKVTPRLFRHFNMIWMTDLSLESMKQIFKSILEGFFDSNKTVVSEIDELMDSALDLYNKIRTVKLPTPSKSHYTFNLRDLSKVIQGMIKCFEKEIVDKKSLVNLWIHETSRQFRDRLVEEDDKWFDLEIEDIYTNKFNLDKAEMITVDKLVFTKIISDTYKLVTDFDLLTKRINEALDMYNITMRSAAMSLVFFKDAINHFCRISRILSQERGNALLVGLGGSGRQSLTNLVGSYSRYKINYLQIGKGYTVDSFWRDIADMLKEVGSAIDKSKKGQIFLFSDTQIIYESFLEDINNILNNGEVPNLLKEDDMNKIFNDLRDMAKEKNYPDTKDGVYQYFVSNVRDNLHIVLCFSPVGEGFRNRCRQFPAIINCCTIDWFNIWPEEALKSVALKNLSIIGAQGQGAYSNLTPLGDLIPLLSNCFVKIQTKALGLAERFKEELRRAYYITPTSYLEFIKLFIEIYVEKIAIIPKEIQNYKLGIDKLVQANETVKELKEDLIKLEPQLIQKKAEVEEMINVLAEKSKIVEHEKSLMKDDFDKVESKRNEIFKVKEECDIELSKAKPELDAANAALNSLDPGDIRQLRGYPNPSEKIVNLAKTICYIFEAKTEYNAFKTVVNDPEAFIKSCLDTEKMIKKLNDPRKLRELGKLFNVISSINYTEVNRAAVGLKTYVGALLGYIECFRIVKPKMEKLELANKDLAIVEAELFEKTKVLREKEEELAKLNNSLEENKRQLQTLSDSLHNTSVKSNRALRLVEGLKGEGSRWREKILLLEKEENNLLANVIISAAIVSYAGPFTMEYRKEFLTSVITFIREEGINYTQDQKEDGKDQVQFNLQEMLSDPMQIRDWIYAGLPADDLSIENAIMIVRSKRWPLIIDPQMQANRWIKNFYRNAGIRSYKLTDKGLFNRLKDCISNGYPCLLENIESSLDSSLEPILQNKYFKSGATYLLSLGGKDPPIQYCNTFKLFMTSKLSNPHYLPEISIKVTLINFTVTIKGLEDQLLVDVVKHERPDLESQKDSLVLSINESKKAIKDLETTILTMVREANNEILETDNLVNKLDQSNTQSIAIKEDLEKAESTAKKINKERRAYRPIAVRGSIIYFVIASLANIDSMYNYSLEYFSKLFNQRMQKSQANSNVTKRVEILIDDITINYFEKISRGLFEKDKLLYAFLIFINIALEDKRISSTEWSYFLRGGTSIPDSIQIDENHSFFKNNIASFLDIKTYRKILCLKDMSVAFYDMENLLNKNAESEEDKNKWREFMVSDTPHNCKLPSNIESLLTEFYKLGLVKTLREEKLIFAIKNYIKDKKFLETPPFNIGTAFEDSLKSTPLIFILSPGANPVKFLRDFAVEKGISLKNISLGRGQGEIAKNAISSAKDTGDWVCLENCHLAKSFMPTLEEILEDLNENESVIHSNFRLWLTSMPSDKFPVSILQSGVKITNEPPKGIRANLKGTFQNLKEDDIITQTKSYETGKMIFSLAFFHAIILERRKYGPLGWNIPYEWMNSDFEASKLHVKMYIEAHSEVPFKILQYLVGVINYGGRVTDDKDAKLISAILKNYFNDLVLDEFYKFSSSGVYYAPKMDNFQEVAVYLDTLPFDDEPDVFGLHQNANITLQSKLVKEFMDPLIFIQPRTAQSGGMKPDEEVLDLKQKISDLFKKEDIQLLDKKKGKAESIYVKDSTTKKSPLGNFLLQESDKFNNLFALIKSSLTNLELAVKGQIVMSPDIEKIYSSFLTKSVPKIWEDNAYLSKKPLASWAADLVQRIIFMSKWLYIGPPKSFWISAFFFPQGFNTAVLQTYARETNIPIDSLTFNTNILKNDKNDENLELHSTGLNIHGLYLQGASWNTNQIKLKEPEFGELSIEMPCIWLEPIQVKDLKKTGYYECPLYKTSQRAGELSTTGHSTNFVMYFYLKCDEEPDHWIRRGAALLTQLDS